MGLLNAVTSWYKARYEKYVAEMADMGFCPDCRGRGYNPYAPNEFYYAQVYDCPGCDGTGQYEAWFMGRDIE
ncbi:methionine aminopeptidase [Peribacillus sp. SCS-26]|uniref:methionine aminopeptidase n=1 Tax=Paraperibacillus TaxID=3450404 RepID=UPI0039059180